jgi:DNA-binding LacI/PurR family transcriptional regulator
MNRKSACIVIKPEEHLYIPLAHRIMADLQRNKYQVLAQDLYVVLEEKETAISLPITASTLIVEAASRYIAELLRKAVRNVEFSVAVLPEEPCEDMFSASIETNTFDGGYIAAKHCIECGYRRLVYFTNPMKPDTYCAPVVRRHYDGVQKACSESGLELLLRDVAEFKLFKREIVEWQILRREVSEEESKLVSQMLEEVGKGCAVLSHMDFLASLVYRVAKNIGWRVPEDLGVVGFYNTAWSALLGLTTVDVQPEALASQAVSAVLNKRKGKVIVPPKLVARGSTPGRPRILW